MLIDTNQQPEALVAFCYRFNGETAGRITAEEMAEYKGRVEGWWIHVD